MQVRQNFPVLDRRAWLWAGATLAVVAVAANAPYVALIDLFDYDDVLRRPAGEVLQLFHDRGTPLVIAWWTFALGAMGLAIAAALLGEALKGGTARLAPVFTTFGILSGVLQTAALLRWTFAIPPLAAQWAAAGPGSAERAAAEVMYGALNTFGGMAIGEHLGQLLLVIWTFGVGTALWRTGGLLRWIGVAGLATLPVWIVGQTELLGVVMPELPVIEVIPYAFMAWEAWLLVLGLAMLATAIRARAVSATEP